MKAFTAYINPLLFQCLSRARLKLLTVALQTTLSGKQFHSFITRCEKKYFLQSSLQAGLANFNEWPLVLLEAKVKYLDSSTDSNPLIILNVSIKSPLILLLSNVVNPN